MIRAYFKAALPESDGLFTLTFRPERRLDFIAGQYTELTLPQLADDNRRFFTISSGPDETLIAITLRYEPARASEFKQKLFALRPGDEVRLSEPMGDFVLPKSPTVPLVWLAIGLGITPFLSMAKWLAARAEQRSIRLLHFARSESDRIQTAALQRAGCQLRDYLIDDDTFVKNSEAWAAATEMPAAALFYIAGPETSVTAARRMLHKNGIADSRIVTDAFLGYKE